MTTQLRIFTINRGKMDEFVKAWKDGVYPLRLRHGYRIEGAWVAKDRNEFVWVLSHDGEGWDAREAAYYASEERAAVDPDPRQYIAKVEYCFLTRVV